MGELVGQAVQLGRAARRLVVGRPARWCRGMRSPRPARAHRCARAASVRGSYSVDSPCQWRCAGLVQQRATDRSKNALNASSAGSVSWWTVAVTSACPGEPNRGQGGGWTQQQHVAVVDHGGLDLVARVGRVQL